ncbi:MAG: ATP-dependent zinc metalloprotease FtsH [Planctomycetota bacterium]
MNDNRRFKSEPSESMPRHFILFLVILMAVVVIVSLSGMLGRKKEAVSFKAFAALVDEQPGELQDVTFRKDQGFTYTRKGDPENKVYTVATPEEFDQNPRFSEINEALPVEVKQRNRFLTEVLPNILVILGVFLLIYFFFFRKLGQRGDGFMAFGKSRAKLVTPEMCASTFADVAGIDEAVEEVREVVAFLKNPEAFSRLGGRLPRGVLLVGPPGVGKTILAKAIAGEASVPFYSISGSDFVELFVGVGASRVRDLFQQAKDRAPAIIFLDELDAIGRRRGTGLGGGHDEREQTLNAILVEMDGFERQTNVIIVAATNRQDVLDPALLRPGRFDRQVYVSLPDINGREAILRVHARHIVMAKDMDLKVIARATPMASGAELENILNEAALIAVQDKKNEVDMESVEKAREKVMWGKEKKSRVVSMEDRRVTALHESGHAVCAKAIPEVDPLHKVSIIPRGHALGMTMMVPERDQYAIGRRKFLANVTVMLAGRAAEELFASDITSGAADDLDKATGLVRRMVCEWGMSTELGLATYQGNTDYVFLGNEITREQHHSEETLRKIDREIATIFTACYERARTILKDKEPVVRAMVELLLERETLTAPQVDRLFNGKVADAPPAAPEAAHA